LKLTAVLKLKGLAKTKKTPSKFDGVPMAEIVETGKL
jgi:hypothetical protein